MVKWQRWFDYSKFVRPYLLYTQAETHAWASAHRVTHNLERLAREDGSCGAFSCKGELGWDSCC